MIDESRESFRELEVCVDLVQIGKEMLKGSRRIMREGGVKESFKRDISKIALK